MHSTHPCISNAHPHITSYMQRAHTQTQHMQMLTARTAQTCIQMHTLANCTHVHTVHACTLHAEQMHSAHACKAHSQHTHALYTCIALTVYTHAHSVYACTAHAYTAHKHAQCTSAAHTNARTPDAHACKLHTHKHSRCMQHSMAHTRMCCAHPDAQSRCLQPAGACTHVAPTTHPLSTPKPPKLLPTLTAEARGAEAAEGGAAVGQGQAAAPVQAGCMQAGRALPALPHAPAPQEAVGQIHLLPIDGDLHRTGGRGG